MEFKAKLKIILKVLFIAIFFIALTIITQIGGVIFLVSSVLNKKIKWEHKLKPFISFIRSIFQSFISFIHCIHYYNHSFLSFFLSFFSFLSFHAQSLTRPNTPIHASIQRAAWKVLQRHHQFINWWCLSRKADGAFLERHHQFVNWWCLSRKAPSIRQLMVPF